MNVRIHIERLVLNGLAVSAAEAPLIQEALQTELVRLIAEGGLSPGVLAGGAINSLGGGALRLKEGGTANELGEGIAGSVYGGIGR
jgi:hypothetical protein